MRRLRALIICALGLLSTAPPVHGQATSCQPSWLPTFGQVPGISYWNGSESPAVQALTVFDDGSGPALYVGGAFAIAGGVATSAIARWSGSSWSTLDGGTNGEVSALAVFDDGTGPGLYAGGRFYYAGDIGASCIARWNGTSWSALGSGLDGKVSYITSAYALCVYDDGSGPALYVGGDFDSAGGVAANAIARWNGASWSALGRGMHDPIRALTVFDDGSGPALYAGGYFTTAGSVAANRIAKWNGSSWSVLGRGLSGVDFPRVEALTVFDDGSGPALCAGGWYTTAGGVAASCIAQWDGSNWAPLGSGTDFIVSALTTFDDGSGPTLCAGGYFTTAGGVTANRIAQWNGTSWSPLGGGMNAVVDALSAFDDGGGPALYAGGGFSSGLGSPDSYLAKWGCPLPAPWTDLGLALSGSTGEPQLLGTGTLIGGQPASIDLSNANPSAPAALFVGLSNTPTPFKGGTLIPIPSLLVLPTATSPAGTIGLPFAWPTGLPSSLSIYHQYAIKDAVAVQGVALSNALKSTTP